VQGATVRRRAHWRRRILRPHDCFGSVLVRFRLSREGDTGSLDQLLAHDAAAAAWWVVTMPWCSKASQLGLTRPWWLRRSSLREGRLRRYGISVDGGSHRSAAPVFRLATTLDDLQLAPSIVPPLLTSRTPYDRVTQRSRPRRAQWRVRAADYYLTTACSCECATVTYVTTVPFAGAQAQLSRLIDEAASTHERFEISRNGHRAAVLLSADDYDILQDTIAVLSDPELLSAHAQGRAAIHAGDYLDADQLAHAMREAGRLSR